MPIKGLSEVRKIPRLGKIKLGIKVKHEKSGNEYPKATDFFVVPDEIKEFVGDQPTELNIVFVLDNEEMIASQYYRAYSASRGLICTGDGETARMLIGVKTRKLATHEDTDTQVVEIKCPGEECPYYQRAKCRKTMLLQFLLTDVPVGGVGQKEA